jgi:hypothetical protein
VEIFAAFYVQPFIQSIEVDEVSKLLAVSTLEISTVKRESSLFFAIGALLRFTVTALINAIT